MLSTRILTAAVALPLAVVAIALLPPLALAAVVALLMLAGAGEWAALTAAPRRLFVPAAAALIALALAWDDPGAAFSLADALLALAAVYWLTMIYWVIRYPRGFSATLGRPRWSWPVGLIVLCAPVLAVTAIDDAAHGPLWVLLLCLMIWGADTGAYVAGRTFGRHKLVPRVSPGKTVEGALGGVAVAMLAGALGAFALGYDGSRTIAMVGLGAWVAVISIVGDLTLSMFKRAAGVKDSGRLFPGHGGVLDRLDSLLAAAPWFVIGLHLVLRST